ncbi:hypothetical protein I4U23_016039 [Adineta vaga]|nr:hypothetical protein I4U23_016039 [Adineta vaga]
MIDWIHKRLTIQNRKIDYKDADYLKVIGAGLPRTGTSSLKAALEILGFGPCHHMAHVFEDAQRAEQFICAFDDRQVDFSELMKGYGSTVDAPTVVFYKDIHRTYPKAKIILTVRDSAEKWFESVQNTIGSSGTDLSYLIIVYPIRFIRLQCLVNRKVFQTWIKDYGSLGPHIHDLHNEKIIKENRKDDLLVFNVKEGWPPLCKFLDVPIPENIPFPNVNDTKHLQRIFRIIQFAGTMIWFGIFLVIGTTIYIFLRFMN